MRKCANMGTFLTILYMRRSLVIYNFATCNNFLIYEENFICFFVSAVINPFFLWLAKDFFNTHIGLKYNILPSFLHVDPKLLLNPNFSSPCIFKFLDCMNRIQIWIGHTWKLKQRLLILRMKTKLFNKLTKTLPNGAQAWDICRKIF